MIITALIALLASVITALFSLVPDATLDMSALTTGSYDVASWMIGANAFFPMTVLAACFSIAVAVDISVLLFRGALLLYSLLPFKAT
jgi:hypothetical protein